MIDKNTLRWFFTRDNFPSFRCPRCSKGNLVPSGEFQSKQPTFSKLIQSEHWSDLDMIDLRMNGELVCSHNVCGEIVGFTAIGGVDHDQMENKIDEIFQIKTIFPAPWIIELPKELPEPVKKPLLASFETYWANKQLCANAIRQAIEAILDYHKVDRISAKGKRLPLGSRIDLLKGIKPEFSELFELFRPFLNAGSHGEEIEISSLLNVFEALEIHLSQVFDTKSNRLAELKALLKKANVPD